jgi:hypothetical protein
VATPITRNLREMVEYNNAILMLSAIKAESINYANVVL